MLALWAWPLGHSIDTRFGLLRGPYIASASRDKVVYVISGGWHTEVGLPVAEISGPNRVLEVPTDDRFGYGQRVLRWFMHERQGGAETGPSNAGR